MLWKPNFKPMGSTIITQEQPQQTSNSSAARIPPECLLRNVSCAEGNDSVIVLYLESRRQYIPEHIAETSPEQLQGRKTASPIVGQRDFHPVPAQEVLACGSYSCVPIDVARQTHAMFHRHVCVPHDCRKRVSHRLGHRNASGSYFL